MSNLRISVVIPSRDRPAKLLETLACLERQTFPREAFEVIVCDDGSAPPLDASGATRLTRLVRLTGEGRSRARNQGAATAAGTVLVFLDDDVSLSPTGLEEHAQAHRAFERALVTGALSLPSEAARSPFGRFRQDLEDAGLPLQPGIAPPNFCAAGNASIPRECFEAVSGFDAALASAEDQDLALRHCARGGVTVHWPAAAAMHRDDALALEAYCRRTEWGMQEIVPFCKKHAALSENVRRVTVNGPIRRGEPVEVSARKLMREALSRRVPRTLLHRAVSLLEVRSPHSSVLPLLYRLALGVHIQRGFRRGLCLYGPVDV